MSSHQVHIFYHIWFKWLDPLVLAPTIYALIFTPQVMLDALAPPPLSTYNPNQGFLLHQLAAMYAFVGIMLGVALRVSSDIKVWRVVVAGVLFIDVAMLASNYVSLKQQDRLSLEAMRGEDWGSMLFTALVTVIRIFFLAGFGVRDSIKSKNT